MKRLRYMIAPILALVSAGLLFYYLAETLFVWRVVLAAFLFIATFVLIDGFLRFE